MTTLGRHLINIDLFTDAYRVSGRTQIGTAGLLSELNNPNSDYLDLEDAYLSRIHEPGKIVADFAVAAFRKSNISFIILQDRRDGTIGPGPTRSVYSRGRPVRVFLTVPAFELRGEVIHEGQVTPSAIMLNTLGNFQSIFAAEASAARFPDISYSGDLMLVQKERIGMFCLERPKN
jgi:hypothetical protein